MESRKDLSNFNISDACPNSSATGEIPNAPKKRKVRKGTQSCWECKRRKIRCTFATPIDAICDGCKSRQTKCISQKFHDEAVPVDRKVDRLDRVESLFEQLIERSDANMSNISHRGQPEQDGNLQPTKSTEIGLPPPIPGLDLESQMTNSLHDISHALLAAWPNQHDLDMILNVPVGVSALLHGVICQSYSAIFSGQIESPRRMLEPPSPGFHPILIARRLLLLATFLQGIPPCSAARLVGLSSDYRAIMSHAFNTATKFITSNDELINSLEGIECVMIESMYLNNAGNLRRAWLANRRAMAVAQMLGLHASAGSPNITVENETRTRINPHYMWFRLVASDRYLSLMLGLPQGSPENIFPNLEALDKCIDLECMERKESIAASLILQRNSVQRTDLAATRRIDKMLQDAAAVMSPQWWLTTPNLTKISGDDTKAFEEMIRLTNQFVHHHLLVQLHLPYIMLPSHTEPGYDYSKMTAANASRAIVAQFLSFRSSIVSAAYCRGIDFIAFIASTILCLTHIEARCQRERGHETITSLQSLQHQRMSDRGLLERTLDIMEEMAQVYHDAVAQKIASILRPLLSIENNSFSGGHYHIYAPSTSSDIDKQESQCFGDTNEASHALHIQIPYFGTIRIEHRPLLSDGVEPPQIIPKEKPQNLPTSLATDSSLIVRCGLSSLPNRNEKEIASATSTAGYESSAPKPVNTDWQTVPVNSDQRLSPLDSGVAQETLLVPGLSADVDEWALQGVELALFGNFMEGPADLFHRQ